jgi:hypothetical protein
MIKTKNVAQAFTLVGQIVTVVEKCKNLKNLASPGCIAKFGGVVDSFKVLGDAFKSKNPLTVLGAFAKVGSSFASAAGNFRAIEAACL